MQPERDSWFKLERSKLNLKCSMLVCRAGVRHLPQRGLRQAQRRRGPDGGIRRVWAGEEGGAAGSVPRGAGERWAVSQRQCSIHSTGAASRSQCCGLLVQPSILPAEPLTCALPQGAWPPTSLLTRRAIHIFIRDYIYTRIHGSAYMLAMCDWKAFGSFLFLLTTNSKVIFQAKKSNSFQ